MSVIISPNIKKTSIRIDANGNEINPATKQVVKPLVEQAYTPTQEELLAAQNPKKEKKGSKKKEVISSTNENPFADVFKGMLQDQMKEGLKQAMEGLDLKGMMSEVLNDAFKK